MRSKLLLFLTGFVLSACLPSASGQINSFQRLTPYLTSTTAFTPTAVITAAPSATPQPTPTATPLVHVVKLNETISSIALRYGLDMSTLLEANPQINPYAMTVGTEVIVPLGVPAAQIGFEAEPLALEVETPQCLALSEGGLYCFINILNPLAQPAAMVSIAVSLKDASGKEIAQVNAPMLMNKIDADQTLPALAYFPPPVPAGATATAELLTALPLADSAWVFMPASVINKQVEITGKTAHISGEIEIDGEPGSEAIAAVTVLAYDANNKLVGARRWQNKVVLESGNAPDFNLILYSFDGQIDSVIVLAEAYQANAESD